MISSALKWLYITICFKICLLNFSSCLWSPFLLLLFFNNWNYSFICYLLEQNLLLPYQFWFPYSKSGKGGGMQLFLSLLLNWVFLSIFVIIIILICFVSILFVNVCVSVSCPLILLLCYRVKNNSPILCQLFWPLSFL